MVEPSEEEGSEDKGEPGERDNDSPDADEQGILKAGRDGVDESELLISDEAARRLSDGLR